MIAAEDLVKEEGGEALMGLMNDLQTYGLSTLLVNATVQMPEEISALLALFMPSQEAAAE